MKNLITISIDDQELDLSADFSVRFSFNFPLPGKETIPVSSTYWFTIPATDFNNVVFNHANNQYVANKMNSYNCNMVVAGIIFKGTLIVKNASNREYKAFAIFNDLVESFAGKQLSELVDEVTTLGTTSSAIVATAKTMSQGSYPTQKFAFPVIRNETFFADTNDDYTTNGRIINNYNTSSNAYYINYISGLVYNRYVLIPMPYLLHIISKLFEFVNWLPVGSMIDDADFKKLIYYNNYSLENLKAVNYMHLQHFNEIILTNSVVNFVFPIEISDDDGRYNNITGIFACNATGAYNFSFSAWISQLAATAVFRIYIWDGSNGYALFTNSPISENNVYEQEFETGTYTFTSGVNYQFQIFYDLYNNNGKIKDIHLEITPVSNALNRFSNQIDLKNHVPRLTVSEFLYQLSKKFFVALFFDFENKTVEFEHWNKIIDNNNYLDLTHAVIKDSEDITIEQKTYSFITDWSDDELITGNFKDLSKFPSVTEVATATALPTPAIVNQLALVKNTNKFYVTALNVSSNVLEWKPSFDNFYDIKSLMKDAIEIRTIINSIFMRQTTYTYPEIKQQGSNAEMGLNEQGFKLLNYHGIVTTYPFSNNSNYLASGAKTTGVPLQTHGPDGTYDRYGKKLFNYLQNSNPIEMDVKITIAEFFQIKQLFGVKSQKRKIRIGAKNYIPDSVDVSFSLNRIINCKLKLV